MAANAAKSVGNVTVSYAGSNITSYCDTAGIQAQGNTIDVTNLASTAAESLTGFVDWTIPMGGPWDATFDAILMPDIVTPGTARTAVVTFVDAASSSVVYTWSTAAEVQDASITGATGAAIVWSGTLKLSGAPVRT